MRRTPQRAGTLRGLLCRRASSIINLADPRHQGPVGKIGVRDVTEAAGHRQSLIHFFFASISDF